MVEIKYSNGSQVINPNPETKYSPKYLTYHVDKKMIKFLTKVKDKLHTKDKDYVMLMDGYEGAGKSTAAQQWGRYVDPTLNLDRICMTADEFKKAIIKAKKGQCVIYDEAVTGMSAGESITRIGRLLKSMMMQMRQKNLFVIVILPSIFELNKYAVLSRGRSLFHIYESKGRMGYFVGYNKNDLKKLYIKGKRTYVYKVKSRFRGRFYGKYAVNEADYRKKKGDALFSIDDKDGKTEYGRIGFERLKLLATVAYLLKKYENMSQEQVVKWLQGIEMKMTRENLSQSVRKVTEKGIICKL